MSAHMLVDIVEDAMLRAGLEPGWSTGVAAYEAVGAAAQQNLALGRVVIVDAVNDSDAARQTWRDAPRRPHPRWRSTAPRSSAHVAPDTWQDEPVELSSEEPVEELIRRLEPQLPLS
jgi:hypothetical protein